VPDSFIQFCNSCTATIIYTRNCYDRNNTIDNTFTFIQCYLVSRHKRGHKQQSERLCIVQRNATIDSSRPETISLRIWICQAIFFYFFIAWNCWAVSQHLTSFVYVNVVPSCLPGLSPAWRRQDLTYIVWGFLLWIPARGCFAENELFVLRAFIYTARKYSAAPIRNQALRDFCFIFLSLFFMLKISWKSQLFFYLNFFWAICIKIGNGCQNE
jgi:hypothetical protein